MIAASENIGKFVENLEELNVEHDAASVIGSHVDSLLGSEVRTPISSRHCFHRSSLSRAENNTNGTRCAHYHARRFRALMITSAVFWIQGVNALQPLLYGGREYCMRLCQIGEKKGTPVTLESGDQERPKLSLRRTVFVLPLRGRIRHVPHRTQDLRRLRDQSRKRR